METFRLLLVLGIIAGAARADGVVPPIRDVAPEATFELVDGWLRIRVTDRGRPLPDVKVRCLVKDHVWASGETGNDGTGEFPRPNASWCQVDFDLGAGFSTPVPLTFLTDGTVVPTSSPVLDGTAQCCVVPTARREPPEAGAPNDWWIIALGAAWMHAVLALGYYTYRRLRRSPTAAAHTPKNRKSKHGRK